MKAIKETYKLAKEYDRDSRWYPIIALEFIACVGLWCYMAILNPPLL